MRIKTQFVRDMHVTGLSSGAQMQYLSRVNGFPPAAWVSPLSATEKKVQDFLIGLRDAQAARERFRGHRYTLQILFVNTLGRGWALSGKLRAPAQKRLP